MTRHDILFISMEALRTVKLNRSERIEVANCPDLNHEQQELFDTILSVYDNKVQFEFRERMYDKYLFALNSKNEVGISLWDYLKANSGRFYKKRATSFKIGD